MLLDSAVLLMMALPGFPSGPLSAMTELLLYWLLIDAVVLLLALSSKVGPAFWVAVNATVGLSATSALVVPDRKFVVVLLAQLELESASAWEQEGAQSLW